MPNDDAQEKELLERYRRASNAETAAPGEAVRAAILAEGRRVADAREKELRGQPFDTSRPAANDSRWKMTAFGTAGAALVAALLFAPRLWENAPPAPSASNAAPAAKLESSPVVPDSSVPPQEIVVTQAMHENLKAADAASPKPSAPAGQARPADEIATPRATEVKPRVELPAPPQRQRAETPAQSAAPEKRIDAPSYARATPAAPPAATSAPAPQMAPVAASQNSARVAATKSTPQPAALQSAAAAGDTVLTAVLLNQGAALDERDEQGRTPLMLAIVQGRPDVVRLLLNRGADPNIADSAGRTPLQQAKQQHLREVAALLKQAGAR
jgi:hypothetical protein